mgnify:CR=1 FL=1
MSEQTPLLRLENLCKDYGQGMILHHLNLDIEQGEFLTLLGPSGCGKTTTLRMIAGLESVTEGRVWLEGRDITQLPPEKRPLNTVFQSYALFPHMNVFQNIAYGLKVKGVKKAEQKERVEEALRLVRLSGYEKRMPSQLSGGQRQKVYLAMALAQDTDTVLMDEPTTYMDVRHQLEVMAMARKLAGQGRAVVLVLHDLSLALRTADEVAVLDRGRLQMVGTPEEVFTSGALNSAFGVTVKRVQSEDGWQYYCR